MTILAADTGSSMALALSAFALGFRHGIDWDHIAAITDIASSQNTPRKSLYLGTLYVLGHAMVVFVIGVIAIVAGDSLPDSIDKAMGRVVGITLLILGVYVFYALFKYGRDFRMRSRWMLVFAGLHRGFLWASDHLRRHDHIELEHEHEHPAIEPHMHHEPEDEPPGNPSRAPEAPRKTRIHRHRHRHQVPSDPFANYGPATAVGVGVLHGVGAETPTQILIFLAAAGAGGGRAGVAVLVVFLVGLIASNSVITLSSAYGLLAASKRFAVYATVAVVTGTLSLVVGTLFLLGMETLLPAMFAG